MPTSFLTSAQREAFGRFVGVPSSEELVRYFHLDGIDLATVWQMRGATNRLGFAVLLCSVRFTGSFPACRADIPDEVITFLVDQLGGSVSENLGRYFDSSAPTYKRHTSLVRARFGYHDFHDAPGAVLGLTRRLYAFCWAGDDKPDRLIEWACFWLISNKVLLPGVTTLERLVGRVRDRVKQRLWCRLSGSLTAKQRVQIKSLFEQDAAESLGNLEVLRASPLKRRQSDFLRHLNKLDVLRGAGLQMTPPKGVPATHLERLARVARRTKPSAIAVLKEPRRTATAAALFYTLEASAQDDAVELGEALISDLFREAEFAQTSHRQAGQRELDSAVLLLRVLAGRVIKDSSMTFEEWQNAIFAQWPRARIEDAITTVDTLVQPDTGKPYTELTTRWHRARKLFFNIATRIDLSESPGGRDVAEAMTWLRNQPDWAKANVKSAPTGVISKSWRVHVLDEDGIPVNAKAYVFATIDAWHKAVKRRDVFATPGIRYADPRAGLLENREWEGAKGVVCRNLGRTLDAAAEVERLARELDATFTRVARRVSDNPDLRFDVSGGKPTLVLSKLDKLDEPDSMAALRRNVHRLIPRAGIPDILLEIMKCTGLSHAFTHLSDRPAQVQGFETSLCAALMAGACNIGFEPLVRDDHLALRRSRLGWLTQNFIRPETLATANAMIVSAHTKLPITQHWGDGRRRPPMGCDFWLRKLPSMPDPTPGTSAGVGGSPGTTCFRISIPGLAPQSSQVLCVTAWPFWPCCSIRKPRLSPIK